VSARFEVRAIFRFIPRRKIAIAGRVLSGIASAGQTINFKAPDGSLWHARVSAIEFVDRVFSESLIGLLCDERDPREATLYAELCPPGTVVELSDALAAEPGTPP
jgi:hypothetical protein